MTQPRRNKTQIIHIANQPNLTTLTIYNKKLTVIFRQNSIFSKKYFIEMQNIGKTISVCSQSYFPF